MRDDDALHGLHRYFDASAATTSQKYRTGFSGDTHTCGVMRGVFRGMRDVCVLCVCIIFGVAVALNAQVFLMRV